MADSARSPNARVTARHRVPQFLLGLGLGAIPLIVALVGVFAGTIGGSDWSSSEIDLFGAPVLGWVLALIVGGVLYLATLIATIVCRLRPPLRDVGDGLLAAVLLTPFNFLLGAIVIIVIGLRADPIPF